MGFCLLEDRHHQLQDGWDDLFCRWVVRSVEPLFDRAIDGPTCSHGDHLGRDGRVFTFRHTIRKDAADGGGDGRVDERLEGALAIADG